MARGAAASPGAERIAQNGYHYTKTADGWILTHRLLAEQELLKRPLKQNERVAFRNGNRLDLRPENLYVTETKSDLNSLKRRRQDFIARIEELQGQLADLEDEIQRLEIKSDS